MLERGSAGAGRKRPDQRVEAAALCKEKRERGRGSMRACVCAGSSAASVRLCVQHACVEVLVGLISPSQFACAYLISLVCACRILVKMCVQI